MITNTIILFSILYRAISQPLPLDAAWHVDNARRQKGIVSIPRRTDAPTGIARPNREQSRISAPAQKSAMSTDVAI